MEQNSKVPPTKTGETITTERDRRPTATITDSERRMAEGELLKAYSSRRPTERSPNRKVVTQRTNSLPDRIEGKPHDEKSEKRPAEGDVTSPGNREAKKKTKGQQDTESESEEDEIQAETETEDTRKEFANDFKESLKSLLNWQQVNVKSKVISKRQCDKFAEVVKKIERAFAKCEKENAFLRGRIEERREILALIASRPVKEGHVAKVCQNKEVCSFCAGEHKHVDCKAGEDQVQCINCHNNDDNSHHDTTWKNCPTYKRQVERYFSRIDYGV